MVNGWKKKECMNSTVEWMKVMMMIHMLVVKHGCRRRLQERLWVAMLRFVVQRYLCGREGATQGRRAGGGEAYSPPLLLQRPCQLFKLNLLLPDRLQQSSCALTLLHTHYKAPRGERGRYTHPASITPQHSEQVPNKNRHTFPNKILQDPDDKVFEYERNIACLI